jgi:hypothetical protein
MKQDYTLYVRKADGRTKSGWRAVSTQVVTDRTEREMLDLSKALLAAYNSRHGRYQVEFLPSMVTVKNLMTGQDVQIDRDTPWCCNPASETFWSM